MDDVNLQNQLAAAQTLEVIGEVEAEFRMNSREKLYKRLTECLGTENAVVNFLIWFFKESGLSPQSLPTVCLQCNQPYTTGRWCKPCEAYLFDKNSDSWTSGDEKIDKLIRKSQVNSGGERDFLRWMSYDDFTVVEKIGEGGSSVIHKAMMYRDPLDGTLQQWVENMEVMTVLAYMRYDYDELSKSRWEGILAEYVTMINECTEEEREKKAINFFKELYSEYEKGEKAWVFNAPRIKATAATSRHSYVPRTMAVYKKFKPKEVVLKRLSHPLSDDSLERQGCIHGNIHTGNILIDESSGEPEVWITDIGSYHPTELDKEDKEGKGKIVYGLLPHVAPEVLRGKSRTQASDVYSLAIVVWEIVTGKIPFAEIQYDDNLAREICKGFRPELNVKEITETLSLWRLSQHVNINEAKNVICSLRGRITVNNKENKNKNPPGDESSNIDYFDYMQHQNLDAFRRQEFLKQKPNNKTSSFPFYLERLPEPRNLDEYACALKLSKEKNREMMTESSVNEEEFDTVSSSLDESVSDNFSVISSDGEESTGVISLSEDEFMSSSSSNEEDKYDNLSDIQ
ncbi:991_t:CDS:2, partial [Acaulospora colombiana]